MPRDLQLPVITREEVGGDRLAEQVGDCRSGEALREEPVASATRGRRSKGFEDRPAGEGPFGSRIEDLDWVDGFIASIRPYVRVRREDGVLIKMPTDVYSLNPSGLTLLERAIHGERIGAIARSAGAEGRPERLRQIHAFFCDVRDLLANRLGDGGGREATNVSRFRRGFTRYPVLSEVALTYRCNLACAFCYAGCGTPDASPGNPAREKHRKGWPFGPAARSRRGSKRDPIRQEMTEAEVTRVLDRIATAAKVPSVSFTGGECTLRPELPRFIERARSLGMRVNIITNGVACSSPAYVESLAAAGLNSAQVSVEGPTARLHDRLTQRPGSFEKTIRGVANLREAGLHVHTNTTICGENAEHAGEVVDLARSLGLEHISMNLIIPAGTPNLRRHERMKVSYARVGDIVLRVRDRAERAGVQFHWYSPTPFCLFNPIAHGLGNKGCAACDGLVHVSPAGEVLPCSSFARGVGNLLEEPFDKVWFGKDSQYYKKKRYAHVLCRTCEHFPLCQGACTLYWSSMGYDELFEANKHRLAGRLGGRLRRGLQAAVGFAAAQNQKQREQ